MTGIFEQLLAAQLETNRLLAVLIERAGPPHQGLPLDTLTADELVAPSAASDFPPFNVGNPAKDKRTPPEVKAKIRANEAKRAAKPVDTQPIGEVELGECPLPDVTYTLPQVKETIAKHMQRFNPSVTMQVIGAITPASNIGAIDPKDFAPLMARLEADLAP